MECHRFIGGNGHTGYGKFLIRTAQVDVQRVFLSAGFPPYLERAFLAATQLRNAPEIVRGTCSRSDVAHHVLPIQSGHAWAMITVSLNLVHALVRQMLAAERLIIFVQGPAQAEMIQGFLSCHAYHTRASSEINETQVRAWREEERSILVATPGVVDALFNVDLRFVVFYDGVSGFIQYHRCTSRGVMGKRCDVFLVHQCVANSAYSGVRRRRDHPRDFAARVYMQDYCLISSRCRRMLITECFDGTPRMCSEDDKAIKCDICDPDGEMTMVGRSALNA